MTAYQFTVHPRIGEQTIPVNILGFKSVTNADRFQLSLHLHLTEAVENNRLDGFEITTTEATVEDEYTLPADERGLDEVETVADLIINVLK